MSILGRMDDAAGDDVVSAAAGHGRGEGVDGEVRGHAVVDGLSDDPARPVVFDGTKADLDLAGCCSPASGRCPQEMSVSHSRFGRGGEVPSDQVVVHRLPGRRDFPSFRACKEVIPDWEHSRHTRRSEMPCSSVLVRAG